MNKPRVSDIEDWLFEGKRASMLKEGDLVLLHNWGWVYRDQVLAVALLVWDKEYHKWGFKSVAGIIDFDEYDLWRTNPRKVGRIVNFDALYGDKEYINLLVTDKDFKKYVGNWDALIKESAILVEKRRLLKEESKKLKEKKNQEEKLKKELDELQKNKDEIETKIKKLKNGESI